MKHTRKRPLHDYYYVATQFTWIFTVLLQVAKKVLKVPITQAAKLFEGERENEHKKKNVATDYYLQVFTKGVQDYLGTLFEGLKVVMTGVSCAQVL